MLLWDWMVQNVDVLSDLIIKYGIHDPRVEEMLDIAFSLDAPGKMREECRLLLRGKINEKNKNRT